MYLFKRIVDGVWIFGATPKSVCPAGAYRLDPSSNYNIVTIHAIFNRDISVNYPSKFSDFKKENDAPYASMAEFEAGTTGFFESAVTIPGVATAANQDDAFGRIAQIVTGLTKTAIKAGHYAYGCTCRVDGSKIASLEKTVGVTVSADTDEAITGIAMLGMEWQPFINKVTSVTQTAAGDSITYWLKPL